MIQPLLIVACLWTGGGPTSAATPPASAAALHSAAADSLGGRVTGPSGPVAGAEVSLLELERKTRTRADGTFSFGDLPAGVYTLRVDAPGYQSVLRRISAGTGDAGEVALTERQFALQPVAVTATRSPQAASSSPLPTSIIGPERLRRESSVSLARTLSTLPGVEALTTGEQVGKPVIRGLFGPRVAVLADGLRLEDYSWSDEDAPSIDARLAERVEVIRGPASLLYGSDAMGGVVNVIPEALPDAAGGRGFVRTGAEASFATGNREGGVVLRGEGATGTIGWRAAVIGRLAEDLHTPEGPVENTGFGAANGEAAVGVRRGWGALALRYQRYGGEFKLLEAGEGDVSAAAEEEGGPERKLSDDRLQLTGAFPLSSIRLETRAQWQRHSLIEVADEPFGGGAPTGVEETQFDLLLNTLSADVLAHWEPDAGPRATLGLSGLAQANDSRGPVPLVPDAGVREGAVFGLVQNDFGPLRVLAGARVDARRLDADANPALGLAADDSRDWTAASWNVGGVLSLADGLALTGSAGRAWRAPNLFELYANGPRIGEARYDRGDPALGTEHSLEVDAGLRFTRGPVRAEIAAYRNAVDGYIFADPTGEFVNSLRVFEYDHADALLRGVEAEAEVHPIDRLALRGTYDQVRGTIRGSGDPLPSIPPRRGRVEAEWRLGGSRLLPNGYATAAVQMVARQTHHEEDEYAPPGYTLLDLGFGAEPRLAGRLLRVDVQLRNATNEAYASFLSRYKDFALDPGRSLVLRIGTGI